MNLDKYRTTYKGDISYFKITGPAPLQQALDSLRNVVQQDINELVKLRRTAYLMFTSGLVGSTILVGVAASLMWLAPAINDYYGLYWGVLSTVAALCFFCLGTIKRHFCDPVNSYYWCAEETLRDILPAEAQAQEAIEVKWSGFPPVSRYCAQVAKQDRKYTRGEYRMLLEAISKEQKSGTASVA